MCWELHRLHWRFQNTLHILGGDKGVLHTPQDKISLRVKWNLIKEWTIWNLPSRRTILFLQSVLKIQLFISHMLIYSKLDTKWLALFDFKMELIEFDSSTNGCNLIPSFYYSSIFFLDLPWRNLSFHSTVKAKSDLRPIRDFPYEDMDTVEWQWAGSTRNQLSTTLWSPASILSPNQLAGISSCHSV